MAGAQTIILGGGLAGISAAMHMERPYLLVEREDRLGGLARTESRDGYFFDHTGHWLHLRDPYMTELVERVTGNTMVEVARKARIYSHGELTLYPFQANLHGLPKDVVYECLLGFVNAVSSRSDEEPGNFEDYILHHFGEGIAKHFMVPYNHKLWGVHPREITSAWCSRFVPRPSVEQVLAGALGVGPAQLGYNIKFRYPKQGGIETFAKALIGTLDDQHTQLSSTVEQINVAQRTVTIAGETQPYHAVIASIPLGKIVELLAEPPAEVVEAASKLRATAVQYLNVGTRKPAPADYHWVYVPEERLPFYRVGVFSNAMPTMAPDGCSSLYVELSTRSISDREGVTRDALQALTEVQAIGSVDDVVFADWRVIEPAYVIFDDNYFSALDTIIPYLERHHIFPRGRYGAWIYNSMEDSLLAGKEAAERANLLPESPDQQ